MVTDRYGGVGRVVSVGVVPGVVPKVPGRGHAGSTLEESYPGMLGSGQFRPGWPSEVPVAESGLVPGVVGVVVSFGMVVVVSEGTEVGGAGALLLLSMAVFFLVQENAATESSSAVEMLRLRFIVSPFRKFEGTSQDALADCTVRTKGREFGKADSSGFS